MLAWLLILVVNGMKTENKTDTITINVEWKLQQRNLESSDGQALFSINQRIHRKEKAD